MTSSICQNPPDTTEVSDASLELQGGIVMLSRSQRQYMG
jgi:hypothetical protein